MKVSIASSHCYGPFGELIRATGSKKDDFNFKFSTKYEDAETGLLYYGFRYYDAEAGRWLNRDPIGENGGLNLYGMVGNNPVNSFDLLGLIDCDQLNAALLRAQLAAAAYSGGDIPEGWKLVDFIDDSSGLFVGVFEGPSGQEIISFRGTTDLKDWITNAKQGVGLSGTQYDVTLGLDSLAAQYPDAEVVGHSLGGGLASVFGARHGRPTSTFNAAGPHNDTLKGFGISRSGAKDYVDAYYVKGEILSGGQDSTGFLWDYSPDAIGNRIRLKPDLADNDPRSFWWYLNPALMMRDMSPPVRTKRNIERGIELHMMTEVIQALEKQIKKECCK